VTDAVPLLEVRGLTRRYGGLVALDGYSLTLPAGRIHGVIGPNGAGKTTLFNLLSCMVRPTAGSIRLRGTELVGLSADRVARMGIVRTFQNIRLFHDMSVLDNVRVGVEAHQEASLWSTLLATPTFHRRQADAAARAMELLELVGLASYADAAAGNLAYGDQRRLEIARALAADPVLLLLDEPSAGMHPGESAALLELIRRVRDELGVTVVLVAHDIPLVMDLCDRIQVLNFGQLIAEGEPHHVRSHPEVVAAYLGQARHA
jgi:branched-chain amino acid transport system ATP-binding protein